MQRCRHIEGYPQGIVRGKVGGLLVFDMVLGTGTSTAGGLGRLVSPGLGGVQTNRILIGTFVVFRIQRTDDLVEEGPFLVVHVTGIVRVEAVQVFGQLEQVVGAAGLVELRIGMGVTLGDAVGGHAQHL